MKNWEVSEQKAFCWFKHTIDSNAIQMGGEDSTCGDIFSPLYNSYIEVKDITNGARCGQFTASTIKDNPYAQNIYNGNESPEICKNFVKFHYEKKNVSHFLIINGDDINFYSMEELFNTYSFEVQKPYAKRSGTRSAPQKDIPTLLDCNTDFIVQDNKVFCSNKELYGQYLSIFAPFDYFISKTTGELRKRSTTQNLTWHLLIK